MPKVGDRVVIEGTKVGQQRREGNLLGVVGTLIRVRWTDGSESLMTPGAGVVRFEPASGNTASAAKTSIPKARAKARAKGSKKAPAKPARKRAR